MVEKTTDKIIALFCTNYLVQFHIREMAKLIGKSHVTLLPHLKVLEKDKILNAKTIGKNKVYSLNFDNIIAKSHLTIAEIIKTKNYLNKIFLIKKITKEIFNLDINGTIILFGSYAKKTYNNQSDIDLFYIGQVKEIREIKKIGKTYGKTINIKTSTLNNFELGLRKKDPLIIEIIKSHLILQDSEQFVNSLWRFYDERR